MFAVGFRYPMLIAVLLVCSSLFAQSQVLFYSQPEAVYRENLHDYTKQLGNGHQIISLNGEYELWELDSGQSLGAVTVPSAFHSKRTFKFRRRFDLQAGENRQVWLHFEGINGYAVVRLNEQEIYSGSRNFLPVRLPLPAQFFRRTGNVLEISVEPWNGQKNQFPFWMPASLPRMDNGLFRPVYLEVCPETYLGDLDVAATSLTDSTRLEGSLALHSPAFLSGEYRLQFSVRGGGQVISRRQFLVSEDSTRRTANFAFRFNTDSLRAWSPENPVRYRLEITLGKEGKNLDRLTGQFFLRTVGASGKNILLNGKPLTINGINYVFQNARGVGLFNREQIAEDLQRIKSAGFNAVRLGFYPRSPLFYSVADSLGMLCFQDMPFPLLAENLESDSSRQSAVREYTGAFLKAAKSHPSLAGIGMGSFFEPVTDAQRPYFKDFSDFLSAGGRFLVYQNALTPKAMKTSFAGISCFELMERNHQETYLAKLRSRLPAARPVLFSGLSKAISYRVDSTSITHDLRQITELYSRLQQKEWSGRLAGQFILTYTDYFLETPSLQTGPQSNFRLNTIGIYDLNRKLKAEAAPVLNNSRRRFPETKFASEKQNIGTFVFIFIGLINFMLFLVIYRSLLDFRHNIHRSIRRPHGFFTDIQERRLIPYGESFFLILVLSISGAVMFGSILYFFRNNFFMDYLLSLLFYGEKMKMALSSAIWMPFVLVPALALLIALLFVLLALPLRFIALFREPRVRTRQALAVSVWAGAPFLILLPIGMFFYNLLLVMNSYWILFAILLYFHAWYVMRWINGARVLLEIPYTRVFLFVILGLIAVGGGVYYFLQNQVNLSGHLEFLYYLYRSIA